MARTPLAALAAAILAFAVWAGPAHARSNEYNLQPREIAEGVFTFWGLQEPYTPQNGGNIVNTGFIVGQDSVLAIDTGPTRTYAEEMIAAIGRVTDKPIRTVLITHHHPDHTFGLKSFKKRNARVLMHANAKPLLAREGQPLRSFLEILIGLAWISRTEVDSPTRVIRRAESFDLGGRVVRVLPFEYGHTPGDLVIYDEQTRTLFAGDLVFHERVPTVPHADVDIWLSQLDALAELDWDRLVPGHGPLVTDPAEFADMRDYLAFLRDYVRASVTKGDTLAESLQSADLDRFKNLATLDQEFQRSMLSLFRKYEGEQLDASVPAF